MTEGGGASKPWCLHLIILVSVQMSYDIKYKTNYVTAFTSTK